MHTQLTHQAAIAQLDERYRAARHHRDTTQSVRTTRILHRIHRLWTELDHAQRRSLEIRTGIPGLTGADSPRISSKVRELESLWALDYDGQPN